MKAPRTLSALLFCLSLAGAKPFLAAERPDGNADDNYACRPLTCSTLVPVARVDDTGTRDCGYQRGNQWWVDYVAGSLVWSEQPRSRITVAIFDDGANLQHTDLRDQLWTNESEAAGKAGVDDDGNGYVDDVHGWDFVDDDPEVSPEGECIGRASHGTGMASLVAAERNNGPGIAAPGAEAARLMIVRIVGCGRDLKDRPDPDRLSRALSYATSMGAKVLSFSAHWQSTTPQLDAAFAEVADRKDSPRAAIVVASVPNKGEPAAGYPAAYPFRRIVRAIPVGNEDTISPGTSPAPPGLNLGAPSACILQAASPPSSYVLKNGSSNSTAILAGLLAGIWSSPPYVTFGPDQFLDEVVVGHMTRNTRRTRAGTREPYLEGVPLADACILATVEHTAGVCRAAPVMEERRQ